MNSLTRFSSRRQRLDHAFLRDRLRLATAYKRIAGYFRSSILELVGEEIAAIPDVRILCNSDLDLNDLAVARAVREAALMARWNETPVELESLLQRERYRRLYALLSAGNVQVRVVPRERSFLHGKAGVIETPDGKSCFLGSTNETRSAFAANYEILWEDLSSEGVQWVEEEFDALWHEAFPLPDAVIAEIKRVAERVEVRFEEVAEADLPAAVFAEVPLYRGGEQLQPWQRAFVTMVLEHRQTYGQARLLLADEVGLGKTLSLAGAALVTALLDDGPVLILCPSTLTQQWQVEIKDKLGIPSAVWHSARKEWIDYQGHVIKTQGAQDIVRCPARIAIVSTGLIFHNSAERQHLLGLRYSTVVLDEAHKARRRGGLGAARDEPNNLLDFMLTIAPRTRHLLLGTATPIQTDVRELWDLLHILNRGADFVLGRTDVSLWADVTTVLPLVKGETTPADPRAAWELLRNPLPPPGEATLLDSLRRDAGAGRTHFFSGKAFGDLPYFTQQDIRQTLAPSFFARHNPILRHTVLRRRDTLEAQGLLPRVGVAVHPVRQAGAVAYRDVPFQTGALVTNHPFRLAYAAAEAYAAALSSRTQAAGFIKSQLLQRICSSFASGIATARRLIDRTPFDDEEGDELAAHAADLSPDEARHLYTIVEELERAEARDPKLDAVRYFLTEHQTDGKSWLEHGCIIFSQYYDTARWIAGQLAAALPDEVVAVYAGLGKSGVYRESLFAAVERDQIKAAVKAHEVRLVVATDAACEGLNLQTLGTLINIDLPWNPSRLEQRLGRIKRFGQARTSVDMLNLVYRDTRDEQVYAVISQRLKDKHDLFGGLPDTIDDDWIEDAEHLAQQVDRYIHLRDQARTAFELRYQATIDMDAHRWERCAQVLSRRDIIERMAQPW